MLYHISRGGQTYGPYTLADLQRYVASGHVLINDLARSNEMPEWTTVAHVLSPAGSLPANNSGQQTVPPTAPYAPPAGYAMPYSASPIAYPDPPNLHWGLVLLFDVLTLHLFQVVWNFVIAAWLKRIDAQNQSLVYYGVGYSLDLLERALSIPLIIAAFNGASSEPHYGLTLLALVAWITYTVGHFNIKSSLELHFNTIEPLGFQMSGVLTFLFGGLYIQSQLNRINELKQAVRYRDFGR